MRLVLLVLSLFFVLPAIAQDEDVVEPSVYVEAGGSIGWLSLSADARFESGWFGRAGVTGLGAAHLWNDAPELWSGSVEEVEGDLLFGVLAGRIVGEGEHGVEVGAGIVVGTGAHPYSSSANAQPAVSGVLGYRFQRTGGFVVRAVFTPVLVSRRLVPAFGLSVGYSIGALTLSDE